jgi:hypothetical protein
MKQKPTTTTSPTTKEFKERKKCMKKELWEDGNRCHVLSSLSAHYQRMGKG